MADAAKQSLPPRRRGRRGRSFLSGSLKVFLNPEWTARREIIKREEPHLSCVICEERKEKRFCPAVHGKICPQCCGEQREVTLDCPSDCPYLQQSREHATAHNEQ